MASSTPFVNENKLVTNDLSIEVNSAEWFEWLDQTTHTTFLFRHLETTFTARKEKRRGGWYWYAYRRYQGKLYSAYLGKSSELQLQRLLEVGKTILKPAEAVFTALVPLVPAPSGGVSKAATLPNLNEALVVTKFYIPALRSKTVPRARLLEKLDSIYQGNQHYRLVLITAPAGFGKTTLLSQWLLDKRQVTTWLSLEKKDDEPIRFWNYGVTAVNNLLAELNFSQSLPVYTNQAASVEYFLTTAINIIASLPHEFNLVLDDYHFIENETIKNGIIFLLDHLPKNMRLLIISRSTPALPLARLKARDELLEISAGDLRFTSEEAAIFLNEVMGLQLSQEAIQKLETRTEGWAAGLQLAALSLQGRDARHIANFLNTLMQTPQFALDYLAEEVLALQPADVQTFLLETSILEELNVALCESVTQRPDSQELLTLIERHNIFLMPLDETQPIYRYHALFAEFLQALLERKTSQTQVSLLHNRASLWYEQNNRLSEAINHAVAGKDLDRAAYLIETNATDLLRQGAEATLVKWLDFLPEDFVSRQPQLCIYHAWSLIGFGNVEKIERRLKQAETLLANPAIAAKLSDLDKNRIGAEIVAIQSSLANSQRDTEATITYAEEALKKLPPNHFIRGTVGLGLGVAYYLRGNIELAKQTFATALTISKVTDDASVVTIATTYLAVLQVRQGNLRDAYQLYQQNLHHIRDAGNQFESGADGIHLNLGMLLYEWNELEQAEAHFETALSISEKWKSLEMLIESYIMLTRLKQAQNKLDDALEVWGKIEKVIVEYNNSWFTNYTQARRARFEIVRGNLEAALVWAEQAGLRVEDELGMLTKKSVEYIVLASLLITRKKWVEADYLLGRLLETAQNGGYRSREIWLLVLQALSQEGQSNSQAAFRILHEALKLAEPEGYVRVFADEGYPLSILFSKYLTQYSAAKTLSSNYIVKLTKALKLDIEPLLRIKQFRQLLGTQENLTKREQTILQLLAQNKSNQEIAEELILTTNTVRTHLNSIKHKLGVTTRYQLIIEAKQHNNLL